MLLFATKSIRGTEEIADAAGRLQDVPLCEAHLPQGGIDAADDHRRRKERRQRGFAGGGVFGVHQQVFQLAVSWHNGYFKRETEKSARFSGEDQPIRSAR